MEDYIIRELSKITTLLEAILQKIGLAKRSQTPEQITTLSKTELLEQMHLDLDKILASEDFIGTLRTEYGFDDQGLERFAELLFDLVAASPNDEERRTLAARIGTIYCYLDEKKAPASFNRHYILRDLQEYIK